MTGRKTATRTDYTRMEYTCDLLGRLADVSLVRRNGEDLLNPEVTHYEYTDVGSRESVTLPNGVTTTCSYTNLNRLETLTHTNTGGNILASYTCQLALTAGAQELPKLYRAREAR